MNGSDRSRTAGRPGSVLLLGLVLLSAACDGLLEVESPSRIPAEQLEQPANAALLVNGVASDFECAFGAYVVVGGLVGDELVDATQTANRFPYDSRNTQPNDSRYATFTCEELGVYTPLQRARAASDNVLDYLQNQWTDAQVPGRTGLIARAAAYGGYSLLLLGEGFCSTVVSTLGPDRTPVYGAEISRAEAFQRAEERFTLAIEAAQASDQPEILGLALRGRARARLNLARYADARADAAQVPAGFVFNATSSDISDRRKNRVWTQSGPSATSVSVGAPYRGLDDPRVPATALVDAQGQVRRSTTGVPLWQQTKYLDINSPIPIATGDEARLIVAEAAARDGELGTALDIVNDFRERAGQPQFSAATPEAVLDEIIEQRRRELFLEGQHLGDVIRYGLALQPAAGAPYHGGGTYGDQVCLPLPDIETRNNPST